MAPKRKPGFAGAVKKQESSAASSVAAGSPPNSVPETPSFPIPSLDMDNTTPSPTRRRKGLPRRAAAKDDSRSGVVLNIQALPDTECWCGISSVVGSDATALLHKRIKRRRGSKSESNASSSGDGSASDSESVVSSASNASGGSVSRLGQLTPPLNGTEVVIPSTPTGPEIDVDLAERRQKHARTDSKMDSGQLTPPGSSPTSPTALPLVLRFPPSSRSTRSASRR